MKKKYYLLLIVVLCFLDQLTKYLVVKYMGTDAIILINNFLKLLYIKNTGISFGLFSGMRLLIILLSILIIGYMSYEFVKTDSKFQLISIILIISGALGNLIDRILRGYVVDFISFTFFNYEASIFNVADSFITIGVILYIINILLESKYGKDSSK